MGLVCWHDGVYGGVGVVVYGVVLLVGVGVCIFPTWWVQCVGHIVLRPRSIYVCRRMVCKCVISMLFYVCGLTYG